MIPEGVTSIGWGAFEGCSGLTSVTIPASVTFLDGCVFSGCTVLRRVQFLGDAPTADASIYYKYTPDVVSYVVGGTRGWDGCATSTNLPVTWPAGASNALRTWTPAPSAPGVVGDAGATVTGDAESGFIVTPSTGAETVEVTVPDGLDAAKVTVAVAPTVKTVRPNGATVKVVRTTESAAYDITDFLVMPKAGADGVIDLAAATVRENIVKETLDAGKGAAVDLGDPSRPALTTAPTRPGLVYTLREGATLDAMTDGASTVGDGQPWTPAVRVKGGASGFYTIRVSK